ARCAIAPLKYAFGRGCLPLRTHVQQVDEEIIRQRFWPVGEDAVFGLPEVSIQGAHAADENRHLGGRQREQLRPIHQQFLRRSLVSLPLVVTEPVCSRLQYGEGVHIGLLLRSVHAPRREENLQVVPSLFRRCLDGCAATQNDQVRKRNLLPAQLRAVELLLYQCQLLKDLRQFGWLIHFPILLWREANACPVRPAAFVGTAERRRRRPGRRDQLGDRQSGCEHLCLQGSNVLFADQFV